MVLHVEPLRIAIKRPRGARAKFRCWKLQKKSPNKPASETSFLGKLHRSSCKHHAKTCARKPFSFSEYLRRYFVAWSERPFRKDYIRKSLFNQSRHAPSHILGRGVMQALRQTSKSYMLLALYYVRLHTPAQTSRFQRGQEASTCYS